MLTIPRRAHEDAAFLRHMAQCERDVARDYKRSLRRHAAAAALLMAEGKASFAKDQEKASAEAKVNAIRCIVRARTFLRAARAVLRWAEAGPAVEFREKKRRAEMEAKR